MLCTMNVMVMFCSYDKGKILLTCDAGAHYILENICYCIICSIVHEGFWVSSLP
jgi:hypothetical protein